MVDGPDAIASTCPEQRHDCRPRAGVRDVRHAEIGRRLQHFHRHMHRAVVARTAVVQRPRPALRIGDELGERFPRRVGAHDEHGRIRREACDRPELIERVRGLALQHVVGLGQDRDRRQAQEQRVAVRRRACGQADPERTARAGPVLDHDALLQLAPERLGDRPCDRVGHAAGRKRHDHRDRLVRIALRLRNRRRDERGAQRDKNRTDAHQATPPRGHWTSMPPMCVRPMTFHP